MKKLIPVLLVMALLLAGCKTGDKEKEPTAVPTESTAPTELPEVTDPSTPPVIIQQDMTAVSLPLVEETKVNENGDPVFTYKGQSMTMVVQDPDVANKIIIDFFTQQDTYRQAAESISNSVPENTEYPYFYHALYAPTRVDMNVLSLAGEITSWSGGAHSSYTCIYANYDMVTGDALTLGSILAHGDKASDLADLIIEAIAASQKELGIWDDYAENIQARFAGDINYDDEWFFDHKGLSFSFAPYEIAPYSAGVITITVPYEKLLGIIDDAYFPVEQDVTEGEMKVSALDDDNADDFSQIAEVIVDADAPMVLLYTDTTVSNVTIQVDNEYTIFATTALTPGDAIMLQADLDAHDIVVHYHDAQSDFNRSLKYENGTAQLVEAE